MRTNVLLCDMNIAVAAGDQRQIEVLAQGLPMRFGAQLAVDVTLLSATTTCGHARARASHADGIVALGARRDKGDTYPEPVASKRCVLAIETGGRWSEEMANFVEELADARSRSAPPLLRRAAKLHWQRRWVCLLAGAGKPCVC